MKKQGGHLIPKNTQQHLHFRNNMSSNIL